jgi:hypothetical protein
MSYKCKYCDNVYIQKCHLTRHQKTDVCSKIQNIVKQYENEKNILENKIKVINCY